mgnify:CR=1 FL=1
MLVQCLDSEFDVPDVLIDKFVKDFDGLPGSGRLDLLLDLRHNIYEIIDCVSMEPELIEEPEYMMDFVKALAMKKALEKHGILYDA